MTEIPEFLKRGPMEQPSPAKPETAPPGPAQPRKRKVGAYVARLAISIPLDMEDGETVAIAITAIAKIKTVLPPGSLVENITTPSFGKMPGEARR